MLRGRLRLSQRQLQPRSATSRPNGARAREATMIEMMTMLKNRRRGRRRLERFVPSIILYRLRRSLAHLRSSAADLSRAATVDWATACNNLVIKNGLNFVFMRFYSAAILTMCVFMNAVLSFCVRFRRRSSPRFRRNSVSVIFNSFIITWRIVFCSIETPLNKNIVMAAVKSNAPIKPTEKLFSLSHCFFLFRSVEWAHDLSRTRVCER